MDLPPLDVSKPQSFSKWIDHFEVVCSNKWHDINMTYVKDEREDIDSENGLAFFYRHFWEVVGVRGREFLKSQVVNKLPALRRMKGIIWPLQSIFWINVSLSRTM